MFTFSMALTMNIHKLTQDLPGRIVLSYAVIGTVWILISDQAIEIFIRNYSQFTYLATLKGLIFLVITGWFLSKVLKNYERSLLEMSHKNTSTRTIQYLIILNKINEYITLQKQLKNAMQYDSLTKLPLRSILLEKLEYLFKASDIHHQFAVIHLDVVHFKSIKYTLGYEFSEQLLIAITNRLTTYLPDAVMIARVGMADEFIILLEQVGDLASAHKILNYISNLFIQPFHLEEHEIFKQVKMGLAFSYDCGGNPEQLLQAAELAVHQCRRSPNTGYTIFNPEFKAYASRQLELDNQMRRDFNERHFQLYYQPIFSADTLEIVGFESLIRWYHNSQLISNLEFIPLAEETGFIIPLGMWVFGQACWQFQQWRSQFPQVKSMFVNINVSVVQLMQPNLLSQIDHILAVTEIPPQQIQLEITETALMNNAEDIADILKDIKSRKINLCIDDFGTGYSSLSYLQNFPFDAIKVDKSFITDIECDQKSVEIVRTIALMANSLDINLVAEGVETPGQLRQLQNLKYQTVQGYLLAKPMSVDAVEEYLQRQHHNCCSEAG
nr:EAL domain-containing protein [Arthrospira sp. PLM2.Bin9]